MALYMSLLRLVVAPWPIVTVARPCLFPAPVRHPPALGAEQVTIACNNDYAHLGIADGMPIARAWTCRHSKRPPLRGGRSEYRHAHTRAMGVPSAMPRCL